MPYPVYGRYVYADRYEVMVNKILLIKSLHDFIYGIASWRGEQWAVCGSPVGTGRNNI